MRVSPCGRVCLTDRTLGLFFCTHVTFGATVFLPGEIGDEILSVNLCNKSVRANVDAEATKLWLCYIIRVAQWLLVKEQSDNSCPRLVVALRSPVTENPLRKNTISENVASRLQLVSAWEDEWFINLSDTTQSLPLHICISTGADPYSKQNVYMRPQLTKHEIICIYFMVCLIILERLALNTLMASILDLRRCWWSWLTVFSEATIPVYSFVIPHNYSRLLFFADWTTFLTTFEDMHLS